jgi:hypothetical protein
MAGLVTRMAGGRSRLAACALVAVFVGPAGAAIAEARADPRPASPTVTTSRTLLLGSSDDGFGTLVSPFGAGTCTAAPSIDEQPMSPTVTAPNSATFLASASTPEGCEAPTVQWLSQAPGSSEFLPIPGATEASYTTPATTTAETGTEFEAVFTNEAGSVTSEVVTLTVKPTPCSVKPVIEEQPESETVTAPNAATFTASASTPANCLAPTIEWQVSTDGGGSWSDVTSSPTLSISPTNTSESGHEYRAVFTNGAGSTDSNAVTLTVNAVPTIASVEPPSGPTVGGA